MTKSELIQKLNQIIENESDKEMGHIQADRLLLDYIEDKEVSAIFEKIPKWYS